MPHCIIEYTRDRENKVDVANLVNTAFDAIDSSGLFASTAIKVRAIPLDHYKSGLDSDDFIHLTIKILPGRTDQMKKDLSAIVLKNIKPLVADTKSTSVEIVDLHGESYDKYIRE